MISYVSIFLGLVVGVQTVEVAVSEEVARVQFLLNSEEVIAVEEPPWSFECDFGPTLSTHELTAVALDSTGRELDRAVQEINLPRAVAEADVVLQTDRDGAVHGARFLWESTEFQRPDSVQVTLDGEPVEAGDGGRVRFPPTSLEEAHVLSARFQFPSQVESRVDAVFGGEFEEHVSTELTAVPVQLDGLEVLPPRERLQEWFVALGAPAQVVAIDDPVADVVLVPEYGVRDEMLRLAVGRPSSVSRAMRYMASLGKRTRLRILRPRTTRTVGRRYAYDIFRPTQTFTAADGGMYWMLSQVGEPPEERPLEDVSAAVAVAGLIAAQSERRRAVVLVLDSANASPEGMFEPQEVRAYLRQLGVPLYVWSTTGGAAADWGEATRISSLGALNRAVGVLNDRLRAQRIVWVNGRHLVRNVDLSDEASGLQLVAGE